jgi:hypothetical protein
MQNGSLIGRKQILSLLVPPRWVKSTKSIASEASCRCIPKFLGRYLRRAPTHCSSQDVWLLWCHVKRELKGSIFHNKQMQLWDSTFVTYSERKGQDEFSEYNWDYHEPENLVSICVYPAHRLALPINCSGI